MGRRGFGPFVGHSRWGVDLFDYLPKRGGETVCAILIETRSAIEHLEEICKVEGIDCMTIAPFDLSTELGVSGQLDAPELVEAVTYAEKVIRDAGIPLGGAAPTSDQTLAMMSRATGCSGIRSTYSSSSSSSSRPPPGGRPEHRVRKGRRASFRRSTGQPAKCKPRSSAWHCV
jgi:2-keto-3-deoxy-L-rhamnonate aldolase RhmA